MSKLEIQEQAHRSDAFLSQQLYEPVDALFHLETRGLFQAL